MRAVVVLRHWLDLSVEETATLLNCSTGAVKSQTAKATSKLRSLLTDAVAALVPLALAGQHPAATSLPGRSSPAAAPSGTGTSPAATRIALVAYTGQQVPGYQVSEVPRGWDIQGGNAYALVLAPKGDTDTSIDSFIGKLVVMLQSRDASSPAAGTRQPVAGRPGWFDVQGDTQILTYRDAKGHWVVIQAPVSLGWDSARLAQFAAGVQVLHNAQQGRG